MSYRWYRHIDANSLTAQLIDLDIQEKQDKIQTTHNAQEKSRLTTEVYSLQVFRKAMHLHGADWRWMTHVDGIYADLPNYDNPPGWGELSPGEIGEIISKRLRISDAYRWEDEID